LPHAGGGAARAAEAAVAPAHQPAVDNLPLAPSLDEPSEDMTAQCPTPRLHRVILEFASHLPLQLHARQLQGVVCIERARAHSGVAGWQGSVGG
jgi:hypothetical protein